MSVFGWFRRHAAEVNVETGRSYPTTEVGSFAHGACARCDWKGPGRRARSMAEDDAELHAAEPHGSEAPCAESSCAEPHAPTSPADDDALQPHLTQ
ncbi:hypothetical protein GCM10025883_30490 [Mobilicoccus caccae]|uniref:Uncharacterized protein n=1 Tax=Mobilicoccus caccae TaxID=1859295 RepID=A0ABQ6ISU1_9MICO|nr:hypothetical protein GCM10025883_30490 [Mobilicoccus caccae]